MGTEGKLAMVACEDGQMYACDVRSRKTVRVLYPSTTQTAYTNNAFNTGQLLATLWNVFARNIHCVGVCLKFMLQFFSIFTFELYRP